MDLTLRLFAGLRERAGRERLLLTHLPDGLDVAGLKRHVEQRHPELGSLESALAVLGTEYIAETTRLTAGSELALLPPVSGGAPDSDQALERGVFELCTKPLDVEAARVRIGHAAQGAQIVFVGTARDFSRGKSVLCLEYEAFEAMTTPQMARIFHACRDELGPERARGLRMLCLHRVGVVPVTEPAVVIAVSSPHRAEAFLACRFLIDELKRSLPIWKKEVYQDGAAWLGERS